MVVIDSLRADHVGCYGYHRPTLPWLDHLAEHGVVFENAYANSGYTPFSHAALFTGMFPSNVPGPKFVGERTRYDVPADATLAGRCAQAGYQTAAFVNVPWLAPERGLMAGFQEVQVFKELTEKSLRAAHGWIDSQRGQPWFCFVHLMDVHEPYAPHEPYRSMFDADYAGWQDLSKFRDHWAMGRFTERDRQRVMALYDGCVRSTNDVLERCWPELPGADQGELITIVTADHGDMFGEQGRWGHHTLLWNDVLRVPLVWHSPNRWSPGRAGGLVQLVDVMPTLCEVLGLGRIGDADGTTLADALAGGPAPDERTLIAELLNESVSQPKRWQWFSRLARTNWRPKLLRRQVQAIRQGKYRLVRDILRLYEIAYGEGRRLSWRGMPIRRLHQRLLARRPMVDDFLARYDVMRLFDVQADPLETRNIAGDHPSQFRRLRDLLDSMTFRSGTEQVRTMEMDAALEAQLRDLGYI
jgi:arylsulfatase